MEQELRRSKQYQTVLKIKIGVLSLCILMQLCNLLYWAKHARVLSFIIALTFGSQGVLSLIGVRTLEKSCVQFKRATGLYVLQLAALVLLWGGSHSLSMELAGMAFGDVMNGFSEQAKRILGEEPILIRKFSKLFQAAFFLTSAMITIRLAGFFVALAWKPEQAVLMPILLQLVVAGFMTAWLILYLFALKTIKLWQKSPLRGYMWSWGKKARKGNRYEANRGSAARQSAQKSAGGVYGGFQRGVHRRDSDVFAPDSR